MNIFKSLITVTVFISASQCLRAQTWDLSGNGNTDPVNHFIGTTNNVHLPFRTNNIVRMIIDESGYVGIGTITPQFRLDVNGTVNFSGDLLLGGRLKIAG